MPHIGTLIERYQACRPWLKRALQRMRMPKNKQTQCPDLGQGEEVAVAGRVMARRVMGKLAFVRLEDDSGSVQLYVDRAALDASQPGGFRCESRRSQCTTKVIHASAPLRS